MNTNISYHLITYEYKKNVGIPKQMGFSEFLDTYTSKEYTDFITKEMANNAVVWEVHGDKHVSTYFYCNACQKWLNVSVTDMGDTGYAHKEDYSKVCYACCALEDKKAMETKGVIHLYLSIFSNSNFSGGKMNGHGRVTNWPGSLSFSCHVIQDKTPKGRNRYKVDFKDHLGYQWSGVLIGDNTTVIKCRKQR